MAIKVFKSSDQGAPQSAAVGWSGEGPVGGLNHA